MLKLKPQYFVHLMQRTDSYEKTLILGKIQGGKRRDDRGWDGWMASLTQWTWVWLNSRSWWWTGRPSVLQSMGLQRIGYHWATELNWLILWVRNSGRACSGGLRQIHMVSAQQLELEDTLWRRFYYSHAYHLQSLLSLSIWHLMYEGFSMRCELLTTQQF